MGIKYSTAKAILQVYQKQGRISKKVTRDRRINALMETYMILVDKKTGKIEKVKVKSEGNELQGQFKEFYKG